MIPDLVYFSVGGGAEEKMDHPYLTSAVGTGRGGTLKSDKRNKGCMALHVTRGERVQKLKIVWTAYVVGSPKEEKGHFGGEAASPSYI